MEFLRLNFPYEHFESIDSTNKYLINLVSKTSPMDGFCVFSDFQTEGKGQYGRDWSSTASENLLASFSFETNWLKEKNIFILHQICSLSILRVLRKYLHEAELSIKWPNDILYKNQKLAGLLIQNVFRGHKLQWSVVGIGLNINQKNFEPELNATSLHLIENRSFDRIQILQEVHDELLKWFRVIKEFPEYDLLDEYNAELFGLNKLSHFQKTDGEIIQAILLNVDEMGAIQIEQNHHIYSYDWSEIRILRN